MIKKLSPYIYGLLSLFLVTYIFSQVVEERLPGQITRNAVHGNAIIGQFNEKRGNNESVVSLETVKTYVEELLPLVEKITGKKLLQIPEVKFASRNDIKQITINELIPRYKAILPLNKRDIIKKAKFVATAVARTVPSKYGTKNKIIFFIIPNIDYEIKRIRGDEEAEVSFFKQLVAHELTHAIQDQEVGLEKRFKDLEGLEEVDAFDAAIEGHAMHVQEMVTKELGLPPHQGKVFSTMAVFDESTQRLWAYFKGKTFIQYFYNQGGSGRVWEILNEPPSTTAMVNTPREYTPFPGASPNYSKILQGMEKYFGKNKWFVENYELTQKDLWATFINFDTEQREALLEQVKRCQSLRLRAIVPNKRYKIVGNLSITILKKSDFIDNYFLLYENLVRSNKEILKNNSGPKIMELVIENSIQSNTEKMQKVKYLSRGNEDRRIEIVRIARDNVIVEILTDDSSFSDDKFINIANIVFGRLDSLR